MWNLQKKPEFKQKFPELADDSQQPEVRSATAGNKVVCLCFVHKYCRTD